MLDYMKAMQMTGEVVMDRDMDRIPGRLFQGNRAITSVTVPGHVKHIGMCAFAGCTALKKVVLEEGILSIASNAFMDCTGLRKVVVPDSAVEFGERIFLRTELEECVMNASGTVLVFCPASVAGSSWHVPDSVRVIARNAFYRLGKLRHVVLPPGLEKIEEGAFVECGLEEITFPDSLREIGPHAFVDCSRLVRADFPNPGLPHPGAVFEDCGHLQSIHWGDMWENDRFFHLKGLPFLEAHPEDGANMNHMHDPEFRRLTEACAEGDRDAMEEMADWFTRLSRKEGASPFYRRAAHYWRYRACQRGQGEAVEWMHRFFRENPGKRLESPLPEHTGDRSSMYELYMPGQRMRELGYTFFEKDRKYDIHQEMGEDLVLVCAMDSCDPPDEDGFGAETWWEWWFLDENMQEIPGIRSILSTVEDMRDRRFTALRERAADILRARRKEKEE